MEILPSEEADAASASELPAEHERNLRIILERLQIVLDF
jgi:hypothetical protein